MCSNWLKGQSLRGHFLLILFIYKLKHLVFCFVFLNAQFNRLWPNSKLSANIPCTKTQTMIVISTQFTIQHYFWILWINVQTVVSVFDFLLYHFLVSHSFQPRLAKTWAVTLQKKGHWFGPPWSRKLEHTLDLHKLFRFYSTAKINLLLFY